MPMTVAEKLLVAAYSLEKTGKRPFQAEDLVVAAWRTFPDTFGLAGYADEGGQPIYPDSNRVYAEIMGGKPLQKRGLLAKVGDKRYQLTMAGVGEALRLTPEAGRSKNEKLTLAKDVSRELKRLLESNAATKYREARETEITFHDACTFWGISARSSAKELAARLSSFDARVALAREAIRGREASFTHGGPVIMEEDLRDLERLHNSLMHRFQVELLILRKRTDDRR
jgi:hypothetical protein